MSFEQPNSGETSNDKLKPALNLEIPGKNVELTPAMQELYDEIVSEDEGGLLLKERAEKMNSAERLAVLGKAVKRVGKLARNIAIVAFAGFAPSLAAGKNDAGGIKDGLTVEIQKQWEAGEETGKSEAELSPEQKDKIKLVIEASNGGMGLSPLDVYLEYFAHGSREIYNGIRLGSDINEKQLTEIYNEVAEKYKKSSEQSEVKKEEPVLNISEEDKELTRLTAEMFRAMGQSVNERVTPMHPDSKILQAYKDGLFKNPEEYKQWNENRILEKIKEDMLKYPEAFEDLRVNIGKYQDREQRADFRDYLIDRYGLDVYAVDALAQGVLRNIDPSEKISSSAIE